jgi:hypothetical protein
MARRCIGRSDRPAIEIFRVRMLKNRRFGGARSHLAGWHFDAISAKLRKLHDIRKKLEFA